MKESLQRPALASLSDAHFDMIVIGGGITGAGIAQDAALRGLSVLVVDKGDFASGTSSKSTKLIHGGLRYLQNLQFGVTYESLKERELQQRLAPHMVWSLPFVIPTYRDQWLKNLQLRIGLSLYDLMARPRPEHRHKRVSVREVERLCPGLKAEGLTGALVYSDCRTDDARHTLEVIRSACEHGAVACNYAAVRRFLTAASGQVVGVGLADALDAASPAVDVRGGVVINATGVWSQRTTDIGGIGRSGRIVPAKGIHITFDRRRLPLSAAVVVPSVHDRRFCFAIPWYECVLVGTTDDEYAGDLDDVAVLPDEEQYLLDAVNALFPQARLTKKCISGRFAGLRPLVKQSGASSTADLSRRHNLEISEEGVISISGGKLTTYRPMAAEVVEAALTELRRRARSGLAVSGRALGAGRCRTGEVMLGGWRRADAVQVQMSMIRARARELGLGKDVSDYLITAYGARAREVLLLVYERPELAGRLAPGHPYILAQVVYAARSEAAVTIDDVLSRRTRLLITDETAALAAAPSVANVLAQELGWGQESREQALSAFAGKLGVSHG